MFPNQSKTVMTKNIEKKACFNEDNLLYQNAQKRYPSPNIYLRFHTSIIGKG